MLHRGGAICAASSKIKEVDEGDLKLSACHQAIAPFCCNLTHQHAGHGKKLLKAVPKPKNY